MHITQLTYFLAVARTGSISKAAEELFVSQSAVSKQILMLEKELGFLLFDRGFRRIRMTDSGRELHQCLLRCQMDFSNTLEFIRRSEGSLDHTLRVGYVEYWDPLRIRETIQGSFPPAGSELHLSMEPYRVDEMVGALRRGNVDILISFDSAFPIREGMTVEPLGDRPCGLLYATYHFAPEGGTPDRNDLARVPVLETDDTSISYRQELRMIMEQHGFHNPLLSCPRFSAMLAQLIGGNGLFMVCDWSILCGIGELGFYSLGNELPISAAYVEEALSPGKLDLIRRMIRAIADNSQRSSHFPGSQMKPKRKTP